MLNAHPVNVTEAAVRQAVRLLAAARVPYAIKMPDGNMLGELVVAPPKRFTKHNNFVRDVPGYGQEIQAMKPGDVLRWTVGADKAKNFASAVCGTAGRYHGAGNYISARVGADMGTVELLLVESNPPA